MRAPMSFFDTTPLGRIVNRFSKDMDVIDENLQRALTDFLWCFFDVIGMIVAISYATPLFLTILPPLAVLYIYIQVRIQATTSSHWGKGVAGLTNLSRESLGSHVFKARKSRGRTGSQVWEESLV